MADDFKLLQKSRQKELLTITDKLLIQYAVEEAISVCVDTLIFLSGRNKSAFEDQFDNNQELEMALHAKVKTFRQIWLKIFYQMVSNIFFVRQPEQLGFGHAVLCAERVVGNDPSAVHLADDFLAYDGRGVTANLVNAFEKYGKTQLNIMAVDSPDISKCGVIFFGDELLLVACR